MPTVSGKKPTTDRNFNWDTVLQRVKGYKPAFISANILDLDTADGFRTIWDGDESLTHLSGPTTLYISSSDAADVFVAAFVIGVDDNWDPKDEIVLLSGQSGVALTGTWRGINSVTIVGALQPAGTIYVGTEAAPAGGVPAIANTQNIVPAGYNISRSGFYCVPRGSAAITTGLRASVDTRQRPADFQTIVTPDGQVPITIAEISVHDTVEFTYPAPLATSTTSGGLIFIFDEMSMIEFKAKASQNNTGMFLGVDFMIIDKTEFGDVTLLL